MTSFPAWTKYPAIEFDAKGLEILRNPGVYLYVKGDEAIYVGSSHNVIGRALARNHHKRKELLEGASLIIFPCDNLPQAELLERELIAELRPIVNERNLLSFKALAEKLGINESSSRQTYACQPTPNA